MRGGALLCLCCACRACRACLPRVEQRSRAASASTTPAPPPEIAARLCPSPLLPFLPPPARLHFRLKRDAVKAQARQWARDDPSLKQLAAQVATALDGLPDE